MMAAKKSKKSVLEYDPLAWLNEEGGDEEPQKETAGDKKAVKKMTAKEPAEKSLESNSEAVKEEAAAIENVNFGFFDAGVNVVETKQASTESDGALISLGSALTIKNIVEFKQTVDAGLALNGDITLDSAELQKIDSAGLQLLFSLQKSLRKTGQELLWADRNPMIESAASLIGLSELTSDGASQGFGFFEAEPEINKQDQGFGFF